MQWLNTCPPANQITQRYEEQVREKARREELRGFLRRKRVGRAVSPVGWGAPSTSGWGNRRDRNDEDDRGGGSGGGCVGGVGGGGGLLGAMGASAAMMHGDKYGNEGEARLMRTRLMRVANARFNIERAGEGGETGGDQAGLHPPG